MVTFHTPIFICARERTLSIWGSGNWKDYVDGLVFQSAVRIKIGLTFCNVIINFTPICVWVVGSSSTKLNAILLLICLLNVLRPCNWRKKRIHFHDFMLNVHSRLQV